MGKKKISLIALSLCLSTAILTQVAQADNEKHIVSDRENITEISKGNDLNTEDFSALNEGNEVSITPYASIGTGYVDAFEQLYVDRQTGELGLKTASRSVVSVGIGTQTRTTIKIPSELAQEFFSTPGYEKYITGQIDTNSNVIIGTKTRTFSELWNKKTSIFSQATAYYDSSTESMVFLTDKAAFTATAFQNINLTFDLNQWSEDTGRLVERTNSMVFHLTTHPNDLAINGNWRSALSTLKLEGFENGWLENTVMPTSVSTEDDKVFRGNGFQRRLNEHPTDYYIELFINNAALNIRIPMDENGDWEYSLEKYRLQKGDQVKARVVGVERETNANGKINTKYSKNTIYTVGNDSVSWEDWKVSPANISDVYDEETMITGLLPTQNLQNERTYKVIVKVDGKEVLNENYVGEEQVYYAPIFGDNLKKGQKVSVVIEGHEPGKPVKYSEVIETIVKENKDDQNSWENWEVTQPEIVEETVVEAHTYISTRVPAQNKFNGRTYDLYVLLNGDVIDTQSVAKEGQTVTTYLTNPLKEGDVIESYVLGHEVGNQDKRSTSDIKTVQDGTNWSDWTISNPTLNEVMTEDKVLTGHVGTQDTEHGRNYELKAFLNGESIGKIKVEAGSEYTFELPEGTELKEADRVSVQVIGHQEGKEDKVSERVEQTVQDGTNWSDWTVSNPTLNKVMTEDKVLTGHVGTQDTEHGRNYELEAFLNGESIGKIKVEAGSEYTFELPEGTELKEADRVSVQVIGHQEGKEDKTSERVEQTVQKVKYQTVSEFDKGYWENYGLVFEGKIENPEWNLTDNSRVEKQGLLYDSSGNMVKEVQAANHNWYDSSVYNGYQIIVSNDDLSGLVEGEYKLGMRVIIDGEIVDESLLQIKPQYTRMGPIHNNFNDLEQVVLNQNIVKPHIIDNTPGLIISQLDEQATTHIFNKYWNKENQLVFDGYLKEIASENTVKKLTIVDQNNQTVYEKDQLTQAPDSWGVPTGVSEKKTFQAIIPAEYSNQSQYKYMLTVIAPDGNVILSDVLN
ncbi:hypothetical protein AB3I68_08510 [Enterococcus sp. C22]|uniref:hypothetical protein n=1 Tax=Enterococcus sp. C22 TaxID=3231289 RepID=UPI0034A076DA